MDLTNYPYFQFRGKKSNDLSMRVRNEMEFIVPETKLTFEDVDGRSSDVIIGHDKYKDFEKTFPVRIYKDFNDTLPNQLREINNWLRAESSYEPLIFSEYDDFYYKACGYKAVTAKDIVREWIDVDYTFKCQPFMFRRDGDTEVIIKSGDIIKNPEIFSSLPFLRFNLITGTQDGIITINGRQFRIKGPSGVANANAINMDCENGIAYQTGNKNVSKFCFLGSGIYEPITLEAGDNVINLTNIDRVFVTPKWRTLAV